ncbi:hypothetical protein KAM622c_20030 [Klebsiella quasipneumoniae subsp. quasipneumoniae]|nr:hypothetical protein KAM622c_20030 [Klebsiella quasipneumoniae subsp. quasipneumoniae]
MLAALNVEGSGFCVLFYFSVSENKYPWGFLLVMKPVNLVLIYGLCGDEAQERGWIKEICIDSAKDS